AGPEARACGVRTQRGGRARRERWLRPLTGGEVPGARAYPDGQCGRVRRAPRGAPQQGDRRGELAAAADRHGEAARPSRNHRRRVPYAVVGAGIRADRRRARLSSRARSRRAGARGRPSEVSAALEALRPTRIPGPRMGHQPLLPRRALRLQADPPRGVRKRVRAGQALGPRPAPQGTFVRQARLSRRALTGIPWRRTSSVFRAPRWSPAQRAESAWRLRRLFLRRDTGSPWWTRTPTPCAWRRASCLRIAFSRSCRILLTPMQAGTSTVRCASAGTP